MAILPSIKHVGVFATNTIAAGLAWISFGMLWALIQYGDKMRASFDVGYSTTADD